MFDEDLGQFFDTDEFAVAGVLMTPAGVVVRAVNVILQTPLREVAVFDASVEVGVPFALCATADLAGVLHGYTLTVGAATYAIVKHADDGTGVSTVHLRK